MTEVKKDYLHLRSHCNAYVFVLHIFLMKVLLLFLNQVLQALLKFRGS
jgi:hypothetical protein